MHSVTITMINIDRISSGGIPYAHTIIHPIRIAIARPGSNTLPIRRPCHSVDPIGMARIGQKLVPTVGIPYLYRLIIACRGDMLPIRRPRERTYSVSVTQACTNMISSDDIPYLHGLIGAS